MPLPRRRKAAPPQPLPLPYPPPHLPAMTVSEPTSAHAALLEDFRAGKRIALARVISIVENERPGFQEILHELHGSLGRAQRIGITGPPGAGKSTLTGALAAVYRERGERVAIIAVDPSSP